MTTIGGDAVDVLDILRANHGFSHPEKWLDFARRENFQLVRADAIHACPDCGATTDNVLGQYVHYSTLMKLKECACGLIWSNAALDPAVIAEHFERTYKDEGYFQRQRRPIFNQLAELIDQTTPPNGSVIDIGGSKGHLMAEARQRRPDLDVSVIDLSTESAAHCQRHFGINATAGSILDVVGRYDTAVLSDVLYYEPRLREAWEVIARVAKCVIIRGPNKLERIRAARTDDPMQKAVKYFNPEHQFVFSRQYIERGLRRAGFSSVRTIPAVALAKWNSRLVDCYSSLVFGLTREIRSPSMITIARRA